MERSVSPNETGTLCFCKPTWWHVGVNFVLTQRHCSRSGTVTVFVLLYWVRPYFRKL